MIFQDVLGSGLGKRSHFRTIIFNRCSVKSLREGKPIEWVVHLSQVREESVP